MPARLKLNVFTPLPPSQTEVANVNLPVVSLLADRADVTVWTPQEHWLPLPDPRIAIRAFRGDAINFWNLHGADAHIFHIGNNVDMHQDIFDICRRTPGLVVLHDANLHGFLFEMHQIGRSATYFEAIERCHGPSAVDDVRHVIRHDGDLHAMIARWPCTLAPCARATGILLHNSDAAETLRGLTDLPVFTLPLPFSSLTWPERQPSRAPSKPPYRLVIFGFLSNNRRVEQVVTALARSPLREMFHLDIFGVFHDPPTLHRLCLELALERRVTVHGFVAQDVLDRAIGQADLALNLRYPSMGEASATQLRIWANGAPSAVTDTGWYATLPDACCHFIAPGTEDVDLQHLLADFCCDPDRYRRMGEAGRTHVHRAHDPGRYVDRLLEILEGEPERRRQSLARGLGRRTIARGADDTTAPLLAARARSILLSGITRAEPLVPQQPAPQIS